MGLWVLTAREAVSLVSVFSIWIALVGIVVAVRSYRTRISGWRLRLSYVVANWTLVGTLRCASAVFAWIDRDRSAAAVGTGLNVLWGILAVMVVAALGTIYLDRRIRAEKANSPESEDSGANTRPTPY